MHQHPVVLKIGGNDLDQPGFIDDLAGIVRQSHAPVIVVHGGGKEISQMQEQLGIVPRYVDGLRVSDEASLSIAEMVLCGAINTRIVRTLQLRGIEAQGLSGMDRGLIRVRKLEHPQGDLGRVGEPVAVRGEVLLHLLYLGVTPVVSPISLGDDGPYNVNADHVAGAIAQAVNAEKVIFTTNVHGVLHGERVVDHLTPSLAEELIAGGVIHGGMLPKVYTARHLVAAGVRQVVITNLAGLMQGIGTTVVPEVAV
ncbi:MAG: acetylglutamate kinase [Chloroflexi bacterium]|nr:acetylglutamate kinase [Chloroflexota bacterium]